MNRDLDKYRDWSDALRERVKDIDTPPSKALWSALERDINAMQPIRSKRWIRGISAAAIVAAAIIAGLFIEPQSTPENTLPSTVTQSEVIAHIEESPTVTIRKDIEQEIRDIIGQERRDVAVKSQTSNIKSTLYADAIQESEHKDRGETTEESETINKPNKSTVAPSHHHTLGDNKIRRYKRTNNHTVLSLSGSGALGKNLSTINTPQATASDVLIYPQEPHTNSNSANDIYKYCDAQHRQPFSIGLRAQRSLTERIRVSCGVNYTHLISDITFGNEFEEQQHIHFIGVPLRVDYQILTTDHFALYTGAGGSVDFCVGATLGDTTMSERIAHYSTNIVLGAEYRINNWLGLYIEPQMSYVLTQTQLNSIWNDSPTTFTLRLGVSFTL